MSGHDDTLGELAEKVDALDRLMEAKFVRIEAMVKYEADKVALALTASDKAITKAETATEKRFESVNEFRAQLSDQASRYMPREVAEAQIDALAKRVGVVETTLATSAGRQSGIGMSAGVLVGAISAVGAIIAIVVVLANMLTSNHP